MTMPTTTPSLWPVTCSGDGRKLRAKEEPKCPVAGEIMGCPGTRECAVEAGGHVSRGGVCTQHVSMWESRLNK